MTTATDEAKKLLDELKQKWSYWPTNELLHDAYRQNMRHLAVAIGLAEALEDERNDHYWTACQRHREMKHADEKWGAQSAFDCKDTYCAGMTSRDVEARTALAAFEALFPEEEG